MALTQSQITQIQNQLITAAGQPKSVTVDGETFTQHSLTELLRVYEVAVAANQTKTNGGLVFRKFVPPGAS
jgi:hypothetical protein